MTDACGVPASVILVGLRLTLNLVILNSELIKNIEYESVFGISVLAARVFGAMFSKQCKESVHRNVNIDKIMVILGQKKKYQIPTHIRCS
jgi:hypothetical protein